MASEDRRLTTTSYAILAQLSLRPWSTYELAQQRVRYFRFVWPRAESAIYREVKTLAAEGLVRSTKEATGRRSRTVYSISPEGLDALRTWLTTPVSPFSMDFEALIRLFVAPLGTTQDIIATLEQVRDDCRAMLRFAGEVRREFLEGRNALQDQVYLRALGVDFFISLLTMVATWVDRTVAEIRLWDELTVEQRNQRGIEIIANLPGETPTTMHGRTAIPPSGPSRTPDPSRTHAPA